MSALPLQLRANDVTRHIINIDSRFRLNPQSTPPADFQLQLLSPIRNVIRIRITSFEFPNNYYTFTYKRKNVSFRVLYIDPATSKTLAYAIELEDGSYNAYDMETALASALDISGSPVRWLKVAFDPVTGHFTFSGGKNKFALDTAYNSYDRVMDYGLGFHLGFDRGIIKSTADLAGDYSLESSCQATFAGDTYLFMCLNDYKCVRQTIGENEFSAFGKFLLRENKNIVSFDDYAGQHIKEVVFPSPTDLSRLHVRLLDPYGNTLDLCKTNFSFSIEVLEVKNQSLRDNIRNSIGVEYAAGRVSHN
jgi:hypothetical protein